MTLKLPALCALVALLVGLAAPEVRAQDARSGTEGSSHLRVPVTARSAALGVGLTSGVTGMSGVEALIDNPAALTLNEGTGALFSRVDYFADADIGINYFGIAQRLGSNQIALSFTAWDMGDIPRQTVNTPEISNETWSAPIIVVGLSYARQFTDRISAGITSKLINEQIDDMTSTNVAFDAGMTYQVGDSGLRFGVSLKNFGPEASFGGGGLVTTSPISPGAGNIPTIIDASAAELPSMLNFGVAYTRQVAGDVSLTGIANFRSNAYDADEYTLGVEAGYQNLVFLRGGFQLNDDMDWNASQGWSIGGGVNVEFSGTRLLVDYAYKGADFLGGTNFFTVSLGL